MNDYTKTLKSDRWRDKYREHMVENKEIVKWVARSVGSTSDRYRTVRDK